MLGFAWWALDFPFMRRRGGASAKKDLEVARQACEKFRHMPTSVINFLEGTRFTLDKQREQKSPYQHLLKPKIGGIGMALETMGDMFTNVLDVTIAYPQGTPSFTDLMAGRMREVVVQIRKLPVPLEALNAEGVLDRHAMQAWTTALWQEKDQQLAQLMQPAEK
nr:1-acyl-sn-glycerol-3-phosphate acyltransferase [Brachymonas sp.]